MDATRGTIEVLDDRDVQEAIGGLVERRLRDMDVSPLLGKAIDVSVDGGHFQRLLDAVFVAVGAFLEENEPRCERASSRSRRGGCPSRSTTASSRRSSAACRPFSATLRPAGARGSCGIEHAVRLLAERLRTDSDLIAKVEELKIEVLAHPDGARRGCSRCGGS